MAGKKSKISVASGAVLKSTLAVMQEGQEVKLGRLAGISDKVKPRHADTGSGLVFSGEFIGQSSEFDETASASLILPLDIGDRIARKILKKEGKVRFAADVYMKKSASMSCGYTLRMVWIVEPETVGQLDIIRDMINKE